MRAEPLSTALILALLIGLITAQLSFASVGTSTCTLPSNAASVIKNLFGPGSALIWYRLDSEVPEYGLCVYRAGIRAPDGGVSELTLFIRYGRIAGFGLIKGEEIIRSTAVAVHVNGGTAVVKGLAKLFSVLTKVTDVLGNPNIVPDTVNEISLKASRSVLRKDMEWRYSTAVNVSQYRAQVIYLPIGQGQDRVIINIDKLVKIHDHTAGVKILTAEFRIEDGTAYLHSLGTNPFTVKVLEPMIRAEEATTLVRNSLSRSGCEVIDLELTNIFPLVDAAIVDSKGGTVIYPVTMYLFRAGLVCGEKKRTYTIEVNASSGDIVKIIDTTAPLESKVGFLSLDGARDADDSGRAYVVIASAATASIALLGAVVVTAKGRRM